MYKFNEKSKKIEEDKLRKKLKTLFQNESTNGNHKPNGHPKNTQNKNDNFKTKNPKIASNKENGKEKQKEQVPKADKSKNKTKSKPSVVQKQEILSKADKSKKTKSKPPVVQKQKQVKKSKEIPKPPKKESSSKIKNPNKSNNQKIPKATKRHAKSNSISSTAKKPKSNHLNNDQDISDIDVESSSDNDDSLANGLQYEFDEMQHYDDDNGLQYEFDDDEDDYSSDEEYDESYSDFDEDDYEEEEDSFDYFTEESSQYSSDRDYELPEDEAEDLIIHQGTAQKRDLLNSDSVTFDSDNEETQIVELSEKTDIKTTIQPEAYTKEELLKLTYINENVESFKTSNKIEDVDSSDSECPSLVDIANYQSDDEYDSTEECDFTEDDDGGSEEGSDYESIYEELTDQDDDSIVSVSINSKYLKPNSESKPVKQVNAMKAFVIKVDNSKQEKCLDPLKNIETNVINNDGTITIEDWHNQLNYKSLKSAAVITVKVNDFKSSTEEPNEDNVTGEDSLDMTSTSIESNGEWSKSMETEAVQRMPKPVSISKFKSVFCNSMDSNHVLVLLKDSIYVYGTVRVLLLDGSVDIHGYVFPENEELEIFSPRGCSQVSIQPIPCSKTTKQKVLSKLKCLESYFNCNELDEVRNSIDVGKDALILLKQNTQRKSLLNHFKKHMSENVFPHMSSIRPDGPVYASEYLLRCCLSSSSERALQIPKEWSNLPTLDNHSRLLLAGGKSVGKSTLLRYLVNRNLAKHSSGILVIDLDIGQPELFVPQTISCTVVHQPLLGPGFFLNLQPDKAYAVGHSNVVMCAHKYLRAVQQLLQYCHTNPEYSEIPWLVNTMGYNKGFGLELLSRISYLLKPTDLIQLQSNKVVNNFDVPLLQSTVLAACPPCVFTDFDSEINLDYRLHLLQTAVPQESRYQREWEMSGKDIRYSCTLSRLSDALQDTSEWLNDVKPLCAPLSSLKLVHLITDNATQEDLIKCIDVNLVYLCQDSADDKIMPCLGIGITRGVDQHVGQVYLVPAMPYPLMGLVNCLALGEMPLPTSFFTNQGPRVKESAPYLYNTVAAKSSKSIKQIYHRPAKFLSGKKKS